MFITMAKEGSTIGGIMDSFGTALSIALQYGVPLEVLVNKFSHTRFEPMGHTSNKDIRIAKSVVDYIARWLGLTFMSGHDHVPTSLDNTNKGNGSEAAPAPASPVMDGLKEDAGAAVALAERATLLASINEKSTSNNGNGSSNAAPKTDGEDNGQGDQFARFQIDAPSCDNCGSITVRNGNCYLCHNCGNSMGCS
jgi:ribonucleoside-diphosphate reductase alpha chain